MCERYLQEGFMGGGALTNHLHKFTLERYVKAETGGGALSLHVSMGQ